MRFIASLAALALLAACATAAPTSPSNNDAAPTGPSGSTSSSRQAQLLRAAGGADAPSLQDVERYFGQADIVRRDGAGTALTYRFENCALLMLFAADARNAMRLQEAHPSARRAGVAAPTLDQCAVEAAARRS
ncbi:hypothetical protein [Candidatus Viadribacter manganicus]|uniref:hypothetical protein n=1 Tax=Candidatus Viadribacter manganicus TaxID=1759059 RepID=UPI0012EADC41|nr:hypothetical protein [Candidatus Viadribacter manganicus]